MMAHCLTYVLLVAQSYESKEKVFTVSALKEKEYIVLYFGAQWQPCCKTFTKQLVQFSEKIPETAKLSVVYISADRNHFEYHDAHARMPRTWLAMPPGTSSYKNRLSKSLQVSELPYAGA